MADMELVIKIPEEIYKGTMQIKESRGISSEDVIQIPLECISNGTVLPDNHGRLIDADKLKIVNLGIGDYNIWGVEDCDINDAPTIIEADKEN